MNFSSKTLVILISNQILIFICVHLLDAFKFVFMRNWRPCLFWRSLPSLHLIFKHFPSYCQNEMMSFMIFVFVLCFRVALLNDLRMLIELDFYILFLYDVVHLTWKIHGLLYHKFLHVFDWKYPFKLRQILVWSLSIFLKEENGFSKCKIFELITFLAFYHQMIQIISANKLNDRI